MSCPEVESAIDTRPGNHFDGPENWVGHGPNSESQAWGIRCMRDPLALAQILIPNRYGCTAVATAVLE